MTLDDDPIQTQRAALLEVCSALPAADRAVLEFLSVFYVPASSPALMQWADKAALRTARGKRFTASSWNALLKRLRVADLVVQDGEGLRCHLLIAEVLTRQLAREGRLQAWARVVAQDRSGVLRGAYYPSDDTLLRDLRLALYGGDVERLRLLLTSSWSPGGQGHPAGWVWERTLANPFDAACMRTLPREVLVSALFLLATVAMGSLARAEPVMALVDEVCAEGGEGLDFLEFVRMRYRVLTGRLDEAYELSRREDEPNHLVVRGWIHVLAGDDEAARPCYEEALKQMRRIERKRKVYFRSEAGIYYIVSLLRTGSAEDLQRASGLLQVAIDQPDNPYGPVYMALMRVTNALQGRFDHTDGDLLDGDRLDGDLLDGDLLDGDLTDGDLLDGDLLDGDLLDGAGDGDAWGETRGAWEESEEPWGSIVDDADQIIVALAQYWVDADRAKSWAQRLEELLARAHAAGYRMLAGELEELLFRLTGLEDHGVAAAQAREELGTVPLVDALAPTERWRRALTALAALPADSGSGGSSAAPADERLVWLLGGTQPGAAGLFVEPRVQKLAKKGGWTKGREVALKRLFHERDTLDFLTDQDTRVCEGLESYDQHRSWGRYAQAGYRFRIDRALQRLVRHPLIFLYEDPTVRVELVGGDPELRVGATPDGTELLLQLAPPIPPGKLEVAVGRESPTRFRVVTVTEEHRRMAAILGTSGLRVPAASQDEVLAAVNAVASLVTVQSAIGGGSGDAEAVAADARPHLQLLPQGEGLVATLRVFPLGPGGPAQFPGAGGATVVGQVDGRRLQTTRDLTDERERAAAVEAGCPVLAVAGPTDGQWTIPDPEDCLELLLQLCELGEAVVVEWPQGERFGVARQATLDGLRLRVRRERDWFELTGELRVDDDLVLDMRRLLEMSRAAHGRFLPLGDGQFLALTEQFRRRLAEIDVLGEAHGEGARFHRLLTPVVEELAEDTGGLEADEAWTEQRRRLAQARDLEPEAPATLQARLRDYQVEGYRWLARLSHWGVGACLADDMGLGKTVQALAVVLDRAPEGPTLVVAPTSVGGNWIDEARRFAPTLKPIVLRDEDRAAALAETGPFDLVVCSYGLLHREREALAAVAWQTVVLDEAQAIKNPQTRRSQAAMALHSEFRLITTGTPVENHLGELWNLFRFLNPGLLGSRARFNQQYAGPIERDGDGEARRRLRRLVQPFLLRRLKSEVLDELPPRTEVTLSVEMSAAERALYEALRQEAVAEVEDSEAPEGQRYVQILAQIMRLRRACCHPRLALPDAEASSAKMEVFGEVLKELLQGGHKVLVFSQFVDYLTIVREALDRGRVSYQYLDGSTPARERTRRVAAFQAGEGDVFLISLRAGGQGLNLTAADYVVHLDPWWNPAVEDQASDRAHRIGQERPVTVYRLVTQGTIEERIVALHAEKRALADGVLEGTGATATLSSEELLELMRG